MLSHISLDFISDMGVGITDTMINNIESKIENLWLQECSLYALVKVDYFARNIYETETVTSGLYRDSNFRIVLYQRLNLS